MLDKKLRRIITQAGRWPIAMLLATLAVETIHAQTRNDVQWPAAECANCEADAANKENADREKSSKEKKDKPLVKIVSPGDGDTLQGKTVAIVLQVSDKTDRDTLSVKLNGINITRRFRSADNTEFAIVNTKHGLQNGFNYLEVQAQAKHRRDRNSEYVVLDADFTWIQGGGLLEEEATGMQVTPSVSFTTTSPGGRSGTNTWFEIYSNALKGGTATFPNSSDSCSSTYQVVQIDSSKLTETSFGCYNDDASLTAALKSSSLQGDIVVVGTTAGKVAGSSLDTTPIGGTNYGGNSNFPSLVYPQTYMIVGIGGAGAGQVYESFSITENTDSTFKAQLNGTLAIGPGGGYAFHPSEVVTYRVNANAQLPSITIGSKVYTLFEPLQGFWLMKVNRNTLNNSFGCTSPDGTNYYNCGETFATNGSSDKIDALSHILAQSSHDDLIFLVAIGSPFGNNDLSTSQAAGLAQTFDSLGANQYTLWSLQNAASTTRYTLITSADPTYDRSFLSGNVVVSSTLFTKQQQNGSVTGILTRDLHGRFMPTHTTQDSTNPKAPGADYSYFTAMWTQPQPWKYFDTDGHMAAYRYLSYQIIKDANGGNVDDIRAQYPTSSAGTFATKNPANYKWTGSFPAVWTDPADGKSYTFAQQDWTDVSGQLAQELTALNNVITFMAPIRQSLVGDTNSSGITGELLSSAATIAQDLGQNNQSTVTVNAGNISNLVGAVFSIASVFVGPETQPVLSLVSGVFWAAGSVGIYSTTDAPPPSPYLALVAKVGDLASGSANYSAQIAVGFDTMVDNIVSDPAKLLLVGANTASGGKWTFPNQTSYDTFQPIFDRSAKIYFFTQLFGSVYTWDAFPQIDSSVTGPQKLGATQTDPFTQLPVCAPYYPNLSDSNYFRLYQTVGNSAAKDMLILGGAISNQGKYTASVNLPTSDVVTTLFDANQLNLNYDQFWGPFSPVGRRKAPNTINWGYDSFSCVVK